MRRGNGRVRTQDLGVPSGALDYCATRPEPSSMNWHEKWGGQRSEKQAPQRTERSSYKGKVWVSSEHEFK